MTANFDMTDRVVVITGGAGTLGEQHAAAIASSGGIPVVVDVRRSAAESLAEHIAREFGVSAFPAGTDITRPSEVDELLETIVERFGRVDALINNAANDPKVAPETSQAWSRVENFPMEIWEQDLAVGLTGAFICSKVLGGEMARRGKGVILNVASDLAIIAPDQRLYRLENTADEDQPVKPISYSVVKTALLGMTRYLATYWADRGVRVNAISPGGVYAGQSEEFVSRLTNLIPMGRMANKDEYRAAILFLCSDASSYMTGQNLVVDGGRTAW